MCTLENDPTNKKSYNLIRLLEIYIYSSRQSSTSYSTCIIYLLTTSLISTQRPQSHTMNKSMHAWCMMVVPPSSSITSKVLWIPHSHHHSQIISSSKAYIPKKTKKQNIMEKLVKRSRKGKNFMQRMTSIVEVGQWLDVKEPNVHLLSFLKLCERLKCVWKLCLHSKLLSFVDAKVTI